jgi:hypothetical protein
VTLENVFTSQSEARPRRAIDVDGSTVDIFDLPTDEETLKALFRDLFENHWQDIIFGPIIQGAAYEFHPPSPPTYFGTLDGYLTIAFGVSHFHLCIGANKGAPPELARHRRTSRAELYRRLDRMGAPISWGLRMFNGRGEQQITVLLPNPFLDPASDKLRKTPDWAKLDLWDSLRARWLGLGDPDPIDRSGQRFRHD